MRMKQNVDIFCSLRSGAAGPEMKACSGNKRTGTQNLENVPKQMAFFVAFLAHLFLKY